MVELAPVRSRIGESMEDRHLYRGKRTLTDNMWVYWDGFSGVQPNTVIEEETICQCTGLKDKKGKLIWENDIVDGHIKRGAVFRSCVVLWNECKARFDIRAVDCNFPMTLDECVDDISVGGLDYEVLGNKFDNPELLEVRL